MTAVRRLLTCVSSLGAVRAGVHHIWSSAGPAIGFSSPPTCSFSCALSQACPLTCLSQECGSGCKRVLPALSLITSMAASRAQWPICQGSQPGHSSGAITSPGHLCRPAWALPPPLLQASVRTVACLKVSMAAGRPLPNAAVSQSPSD